MKNLRRSIGGMVWVIVAAVFLTAQNMIPNANFEGPVPDANGTWPKPWHTYEWYPMFFTVLSTNARTGTQAMKLQWHGGRCTSAGGQSWHGGNSGIGLRCGGSVRDSNPGNCQPDDTTDNTYNVITLARGTTYELSAWIRFNQYAALTTTAPDGDNSNWGGMRLNMQNNGGGDHGNEFYNLDIQPTPMNVWRQIRGQFTYNETDSRPVQFRLENYGHNIRVDCDMDDVVLMPRSATPVIVVNYPNGGETVAAGSAVKVGWSSLGGGTPPATVDIAVSLDGGSQWTTLASGVPNVSSAVVTMPGTISASCRLRVQQAGGGTASDTSDGNFIISAGGPSGNFALKYDGSDDRVVISTRTPTISNAFTVECWFKWDGGNNHHYDYQVVAGRRTLNSLLEWDIYIQESTRRIGAGVSRTGQFSNATWLESGNNAVSTGTWLHCALVGTGSNYYLYLNRTRVATAAQGGTISGLADVPILVGDLDDSNETFNGVIDELRISNVARYTAATYTVPNAAFAVDANTLGLWHFDEGTGTTTADETANGSAGTLLNGPVWVAGCPFGGGTVNQPPVVNLTSPVNGSTYTAPATVNLVATASDSDGTIASVRFYSGTTLLNTDTSSPYTYSWTGVGAGSYALRAVAQDNQGATSTSTISNITVSAPVNQPPVVNLTSPVNGSTYTAPAGITLTATATDADGTIAAVRFYSGTTLLNLDSASPYTYTWTGVSSGTYQLYATATDNQGAVSTSSVVNVTVYVPAPDTTPPSVPANLALVSKSSVAALISWAASTDNVGVTGYRVYRNGVTVGTAAAIMYLDIGLTPATTYQYTVAAYDAAGNQSAQSAPLSVVTDPPGGTSDTTPPSVPQNLRLVARTTGSISIAWDASTDNVGVTGYSVFRGTVMAAFVTGTSHTDTGLAPGTTYVYTVTAMDAALNYSAASLPLIAATEAFVPDTTPPTVPQNLRLVSRTSSTVSIAWDASTDNVGVAGYRVYRDGNVVYDGAGTGFTDTGLSAGTTYTYRVSAYDAAGNQSAQSAPLSAVTSAAGTPSQESVSGEVRVAGGVDGYINPRAGDRVRVEFGRVVSAGEMTVRVYSLSGALVRTLTAAGGVSRVEWNATTEDGGEVPSGIYILHVKGPALDRRFRVAVVR